MTARRSRTTAENEGEQDLGRGRRDAPAGGRRRKAGNGAAALVPGEPRGGGTDRGGGGPTGSAVGADRAVGRGERSPIGCGRCLGPAAPARDPAGERYRAAVGVLAGGGELPLAGRRTGVAAGAGRAGRAAPGAGRQYPGDAGA